MNLLSALTDFSVNSSFKDALDADNESESVLEQAVNDLKWLFI